MSRGETGVNYGAMLYRGPHTAEIAKLGGQWCMQAWPVSMLKSSVKRIGIGRTARNFSMNGRQYTVEHIQAAVDFVPPRDPGVPTLLNGYHGNADCTCGERISFSEGRGSCRFCGQVWEIAVTCQPTVALTTVTDPVSEGAIKP